MESELTNEDSDFRNYKLIKRAKKSFDIGYTYKNDANSRCNVLKNNYENREFRGLAIDNATQNIYSVNNRNIKVFTTDFQHQFTIHSYVKSNCDLIREGWSVCIVANLLYLTSYNRQLIIIMTKFGDYITRINTVNFDNKTQTRLTRLQGVDSDNNRSIYICEVDRKRIIVLDNTCYLSTAYVAVGSDKLIKPQDVKIRENKLYVLDKYSSFYHQISIFTLDGILIKRISCCISTAWFFDIDTLGNFIITDICLKCIKIFDRTGHLIKNIEENLDNKIGAIKNWSPCGIVFDLNNNIYCVCNHNKKIYLL